jgi:serine/threonine protein kinase
MKCPKCHADNPETKQFCGDCGTKLDALALGHPPSPGDRASFTKTLETTTDELARGTVFAGRYEIIEELGAGGMGRVYRAHDTKLNEEVALKLIKPEIAADKRTVERFHNEIKNARKISHPNVCLTHDLGQEGKTLYITMEYIRGEDLKSLIHRMKVLAVGSAVSVGRQIAEGLAEAHKQGIVHRDLKPQNIMIDKDGQAKIMDFGIARSLVGGGITGEGAIIGTPEYMSPEQVEGKPADARADIYALGIILFEMVTGRLPFEGDTPFSIANRQKSEPPPDPRTLNPQIPADLSWLILRCMEKPLEKRYQTSGEVLADLEAIEVSLPATERAATRVPSRTRPRTSRDITVKLTMKRWLVPAATVVVLAGIFLLWLFFFRPRPDSGQLASDRPSIAILRVANRSGDKALDDWKENFSTMLYDRLYLSKYIYVAAPEQVTGILARLNLLETSSYTDKNLREVGRLIGVKYLASGYFTRAGETFLVRLTVKEASSGKVAGTDEVRGEGQASLIKMADELALKVKPHLEVTAIEAANDIDGSVEGVYTASIEAYSYYLHGRKLSYEGKLGDAIEMYKKAVAIDPDFAMAYRALGGAYWYIDLSEYKQYMDKALEVSQRSDRVPIREKLIIRAGSPTLGREENLKAVTELLRLDPEDRMGNLLAGNLYLDIEEFAKAAKCYEV